MEWRRTICRLADMGELRDYVGFGGAREWPSRTKEPLVTLLHHSDCDGSLHVKDLRPIAKRLQQLLDSKMPEGGFVADSHEAYMVEKTKAFIKGLKRAIRAKKPVSFH